MPVEKIRYVLSNRIRTLRNSKGWSQERLSAEVNIHPTYISRIESGKKLPTIYLLAKIADALSVHSYELLMDEIKVESCDYKKKKIINIVNESGSVKLDIYSTLINAFHKRYKKSKR